MKRCFSCFHEYEDSYEVCPFCGQQEMKKAQEPVYLLPGIWLHDHRYLIGAAIGAGGFGIVYKAWDSKLDTVVAIKEFFASRLMTRAEGAREIIVSHKSREEFTYRKARFLAEARTMAKFSNHKNITNVFEFFEENGTAYIVMELLEGMPLSGYMKQCGGKLDFEFAVEIALEIGNALRSMHENHIIHRDVAPDNIFICSGREIRIKLMDFGAAKLEDSTDNVIDIILKPGYSPPEQYDKTGSIGPWTDIYALGATLYAMLTGQKPEESTNRKTKDDLKPPCVLNPAVSENLNNTIMKAMALERHLRFSSIDQFLAAIRGERKVITLAAEKKKRNIRRVISIAAALAVLAGCVFAATQLFSRKYKEEALNPAQISVWFAVQKSAEETVRQTEDPDEKEAMEAIKAHFEEAYPGVIIELLAFDEAEYTEKLQEAAEQDVLPQLFESTGVPPEILAKARELDNVMESERFSEALFLDQYDHYYREHKQMPLALEVPAAFVITQGAVPLEYDDSWFSGLEDFGENTVLSVDSAKRELIEQNFGKVYGCPEDEFMNPEANASPVLLSSTMKIDEVNRLLTKYLKKCVYPDMEMIRCRFTWEWSIGSGSEDQIAAAERLLSWMLGNGYQSFLMIEYCQDGQIPVNGECFRTKTENDDFLAPLAQITDKLVFER